MRESNKSPRGFTLIEVVIYLGTLAIFLTILTQIFTSILDIRLKTEATSSLEQDSRYILSRLLYDVQRAQTITTPGILGGVSPQLVITIDGVSYTYSNSGGLLLLADGTGSYPLNGVGTTVSGLTFQRLGTLPTGKNTIKVNMTLTGVARPSTQLETKAIQTTIGQR